MRIRSDWRERLERLTEGANRAGISKQAGLSPTYLRDVLERGQTPTLKSATKLSEGGLQIPLTDWYLEGDSAQPHALSVSEGAGYPRDVPVREGALCGEDGAFEFENQTADYVPRPPRLAGVKDAYALYVRGSSMEPWREEGELVYVHPGRPCRPNDYVVVQLKPRSPGLPPPSYIKRLVSQNDSEIKVLQYNPRKTRTFPRERVASIHRIMDWAELLGA